MDKQFMQEVLVAIAELHDLVGDLITWPFISCEEFDTRASNCKTCKSMRACLLNKTLVERLEHLQASLETIRE